MNKIIISPPFGTYLDLPGTTSVIGTFTLEKRPGLIEHALRSFRPYRGGFVNKIGIRNKGLRHFIPNKKARHSILSIAAIEYDEWAELAHMLSLMKQQYDDTPPFIELNLSCPNVKNNATIDRQALELFHPHAVILKLPPTDECLEMISLGLSVGITRFHLCNTLPSERGGISGPLLKEKSLHYIKQANAKYGDEISVIGGGGIYSVADAKAYLQAGCDSLSLATVAFNPYRFYHIWHYINKEINTLTSNSPSQ